MKIYTKSGDKGRTSLATGKRVSKSDMRLEAYGTADELNSYVGLLSSSLQLHDSLWVKEVLCQQLWIQNRLFDLGAILAGADMDFSVENVAKLECWIDAMDSELPVLKSFVLPGGSEEISRCHLCRCVARRLERHTVGYCEASGESMREAVLQYINRLSDSYFVLSRFIAKNLEISVLNWEK